MASTKEKDKIDQLLTQFPLYSEDLGIDLTKPSGRFKWFVASILFGARISENIASKTYKAFEKASLDSPEKIMAAGWDELVSVLDSGGYVRYDFSTATKLLNIMTDLKKKYGSLEELYRQSSNVHVLEKRLQEFKGIGPVTTQIFLRELRGVWNLNQGVSSRSNLAAKYLEIDLSEFEGEKLSRVETALVKLSLRCCKRKICPECPIKEFCKEIGNK
jgi:endonuclease III